MVWNLWEYPPLIKEPSSEAAQRGLCMTIEMWLGIDFFLLTLPACTLSTGELRRRLINNLMNRFDLQGGKKNTWGPHDGIHPHHRPMAAARCQGVKVGLRWSMQQNWKPWLNFSESSLEKWKKVISLIWVAGLHSSLRPVVTHRVLMGLTLCIIDHSRMKEYVNCILINHSH